MVGDQAQPALARVARALRAHWPAVLLVVGTGALYAQTLSFPFVNWDDPIHTYRNPAVIDPGQLSCSDRWFPRHLGYPMPVTILSYRLDRALMVDHQRPTLSMADGRGFHLTNFLLALLLVGLVYLTCRLLIPTRWAACAAALLFVVHPLIVEPVAWISGRKDLLAAVFSLSALAFWLRWRVRRRRWQIVAFVLLSILGLLSKPNVVFLVPLVIYLSCCHRLPSHPDAPDRGRPDPLAAVALALLIAAAVAVIATSYQWNRTTGGVEAARDVGETLRRAAWGLGFHLRLLAFPIGLRPKYVVAPGPFGIYDLLGVLTAAAGAAYLVYRRRDAGAAGAGIALFVCSYLPVSSLIPLKRFIADTYLLVPLVGAVVVVGAVLSWVDRRCSKAMVRAVQALVALVAVMSATVSYYQVRIWSDSTRLWTHTLQYHGNSPQICRLLGHAYNERRELERAVAVYQRCSKRFGPELFANNLAITYLLLGKHDEARRLFRWILARDPTDRRAREHLRQLERRGPPASTDQRLPGGR